MNKKAFTLVELMGVITVLALISLLIAPTIINQIKRSQGRIDEVTKKLIFSATELYLDNKLTDYPKNNGSTYCIKLQDLVNDGKLSSPVLDSNGNKISLDKLISVKVSNNNYAYKIVDTCDVIQIYRNKIMLSNNNCIKNIGSICPNGTEVNVEVNDTQNYNFYVINDTGIKLSLIMDRNIGDKVAWVTKSDYADNQNYGAMGNNNKGPITALNYLNSQTFIWTKVPAIESYAYDNNLNGTANGNGYQKLVITNGVGVLTSQDGNTTTKLTGTMRARLLTYEEYSDLRTENSNATPSWLCENLSDSNTTESPFGYWFLTSYLDLSSKSHNMRPTGASGNYAVYCDTFYGARPVIELSKSL